jgi:CBS domain-containing protein
VNEVERFLGEHPPFDDLSAEDLATVAASVQVEFFSQGTTVLSELGAPSDHLYVVRTGSAEVDQGGHVVDVLEPGEVFGHPSLITGRSPLATVRAGEDTLCYLIPRGVAERVLGTPSGLSFLTRSLRRFLDQGVRLRIPEEADPRLSHAGSLISRPALVTEADATVRSVAELMAEERVSSVLVRADGGFGIVTDRDLRTKVVAQGLSVSLPVRDIMSFPVHSVPPEALVEQVLLEMLERGIHHLPIVDHRGRLLGVLTDTDVLGLERRRPFVLRTRIERAATIDEVAGLGRDLPESVATLIAARVDPVDIGQIVALIVDALTERLLQLAIAELGVPPAPWSWIALGSEARREQALKTDQDHALAYDGGRESDDEYFAELAERVVQGLEASGIPRCRAGVIASEPPWRRPLSEWEGIFDRWMQARDPERVALTTIAFDYRAVAGTLEAEPALDRAVGSARDRPQFLRRVARTALDFRPPLGFRESFVVLKEGEHAGTLDLKQRGLMPVVDLARLFALAGGVPARRTIDRLRGVEEAGVIDEETRSGLEEAYRVILTARVEHQARQMAAGESPDNFVDPGELGPIERARLKDAFGVIGHVQRDVAREYSISRLS